MKKPPNIEPDTARADSPIDATPIAYQVPNSLAIGPLLTQIDTGNEQIKSTKDADPTLWKSIREKLRVDWTYHSNTLEGSTLTRGETHFFLAEGLTVEGKPFKDFVDAKNHSEAIDFLYEVVTDQRSITESLIKEINALLLSGVVSTEAMNQHGERVKKKATPGQYKALPNHVTQADGTIHWYVEPVHVHDEMQALVNWFESSIDQYHPVILAGLFHYHLVWIHPFDDGNGRGARILMNLILMQKGFFPVVIRSQKKRLYLEALQAADRGDLSPFIEFLAEEVIETQNGVLSDLASKPAGLKT